MKSIAAFYARLALVFALFVALAGTAFGHRDATLAVDESLVAYLAAGGSYADICNDSGPHLAGGHCDACRLVDNVDVPPVAARCGPLVHSLPLAFAASAVLGTTTPVFDQAHPVRAPPVV